MSYWTAGVLAQGDRRKNHSKAGASATAVIQIFLRGTNLNAAPASAIARFGQVDEKLYLEIFAPSKSAGAARAMRSR